MEMLYVWLLPQRLKVTLHLKSGQTICFTCMKVTKTEIGDDLTKLSVEKQKGWPFYIRLSDISAVTTTRSYL